MVNREFRDSVPEPQILSLPAVRLWGHWGEATSREFSLGPPEADFWGTFAYDGLR